MHTFASQICNSRARSPRTPNELYPIDYSPDTSLPDTVLYTNGSIPSRRMKDLHESCNDNKAVTWNECELVSEPGQDYLVVSGQNGKKISDTIAARARSKAVHHGGLQKAPVKLMTFLYLEIAALESKCGHKLMASVRFGGRQAQACSQTCLCLVPLQKDQYLHALAVETTQA